MGISHVISNGRVSLYEDARKKEKPIRIGPKTVIKVPEQLHSKMLVLSRLTGSSMLNVLRWGADVGTDILIRTVPNAMTTSGYKEIQRDSEFVISVSADTARLLREQADRHGVSAESLAAADVVYRVRERERAYEEARGGLPAAGEGGSMEGKG